MKQINIAVIGVGNLGQYHTKIYSEIKEVNLIGIVDVAPKQLEKISKQYGVQGYTDYHDIMDKVDAVSIVTPTTTHYTIGREFLLNNKHCMIEKPITTNLEHAEELISLAQEKNVILQIGHIERFNAAIQELKKHINNPKFIETDRLGPYDPRVGDVGVVLDLMIHDLDIVLFLVKSKVKDIEAFGTSIFSPHEDIVKVRLKFENGCIADLSASRATIGKYRKLRIFQSDAYISVDYAVQKIRIYKKKIPNPKSMDDIEIVKQKIVRANSLQEELKHFTNCITLKKQPLVSGEHGRDALELALEILKRLQKHG